MHLKAVTFHVGRRGRLATQDGAVSEIESRNPSFKILFQIMADFAVLILSTVLAFFVEQGIISWMRETKIEPF